MTGRTQPDLTPRLGGTCNFLCEVEIEVRIYKQTNRLTDSTTDVNCQIAKNSLNRTGSYRCCNQQDQYVAVCKNFNVFPIKNLFLCGESMEIFPSILTITHMIRQSIDISVRR